MSIYFVETEPSEEEFFEQALAGHPVAFVSGLDQVGEDAEILSVFIYSKIDAPFLDAHPRLRLITTRSTSTDHLDIAALRTRGVTVSYVAHYSEPTVAEHTFALLLALSRRFREVTLSPKAHARFSYEATRGFELAGKTLGIIGLGAVGERVALIARAFEMKVLAYDVEDRGEAAARTGAELVSLEGLFARADIISLHTPLSTDTYHILNRETFARCKRGVLIINTARGALIDTPALREALDAGVVGGAGLDVLQDERILRDSLAHIVAGDIIKHLRSDALAHEARDAERVRELQELMLGEAVLARTNVVFTPHIAANSMEAVTRRNQGTMENIMSFLAGTPVNVVE